ncbi:MAG: S-layer homology domain-containing protein [Clostridia bacterium]|nr:S-layer homology domain-containing protein [Clostridia bacterium]
MKKLVKFGALLIAFALFMSMAAIQVFADTTEFTDVAESDYFYPAVLWGAEAGITYGVGENTFDPEGSVTRAQIVTFLWRMAGEPATEVTATFEDVEAGSWYETAVQWAVENNITVGTGEGMFSPNMTCDRAMCITLLYRMTGSPFDDYDTTSKIDEELSMEDMTIEDWGRYFIIEMINSIREAGLFTDVKQEDYFELPVLWACFNGILTEDNTDVNEESISFRPSDACLRKEMISFLYQNKLLNDAANAPYTYETGELTVPIPQEYYDKLAMEIYGISDEGVEDEETLMVVSELESQEAAAALGEEYTDGAGELFRIIIVSEDKLHEMLCGDMSGVNSILKGESGNYYIICYPTDVRFMRENTEKMYEDAELWTELNGWAANIGNDIIEYSEGVTAVNYTNTMLDMYLARIAYANDIKYTISTTEYGPLDPAKYDGTRYAEYLLAGNFTMVDDAEAPDGEYVVLNFPDEGVRYDFFMADQDLVREVRDGYETLYKRVLPGSVTNTEAMQSWYFALAEMSGKKEDYKEIDPFLGEWVEEHAGRGVITITKSVGLAKADIEARWSGSAFEVCNWDISANLAYDGMLVYDNGKQTVTRYDEEGKGTVVSEITDESGFFSLDSDGKLTWQIGDEEASTFVRAK